MKKINLYLAALTISMTACSEDGIINNEIQEYTLDAEIVQSTDTNSRVNIGEKVTPTESSKQPYHRVNWESGDTFCAYANGTTYENIIPFIFKSGEAEDYKALFTTESPFSESNITYAVYPKKRFKGLTKNVAYVGLPDEINMTESQDAVMFGTYDSKNKKMKFEQTMGMLEIILPETLTGNVCIQVTSNKRIADSSKGAYINEKKNVVLTGKGTKTITLFRNGDYSDNKVYCAVPAGDYQFIKISKGTFAEKGDKRTINTDMKVIKESKLASGKKTFNIQKKLYVIDCSGVKK